MVCLLIYGMDVALKVKTHNNNQNKMQKYYTKGTTRHMGECVYLTSKLSML